MAAQAPAKAAVPLYAVLARRLTDPRDRRGVRHALASLVSVLLAGVACGYTSMLAIAGAAAGWEQEVLAGHGCWRSPATGQLVAPSTSTLTRLPALLDADELEAVLSGWLAPVALGPAQVTTSEHVTSEQVTPNQVTSEQVTPDQVTPNQLTPHHVTSDQVTPNPLTPNQVTPNQVTPNQLTPELTASDRTRAGA